jgi:hypothetical protein
MCRTSMGMYSSSVFWNKYNNFTHNFDFKKENVSSTFFSVSTTLLLFPFSIDADDLTSIWNIGNVGVRSDDTYEFHIQYPGKSPNIDENANI